MARMASRVADRRRVLLGELDQDLAVERADDAALHPGEIDRLRRADVLGDELDLLRRNDIADGELHVGEAAAPSLRDVFRRAAHIDAGSCRRRFREEVAAEMRRRQRPATSAPMRPMRGRIFHLQEDPRQCRDETLAG